MPKETRTIIDPGDLSSVRVICNYCSGEVVYAATTEIKWYIHCPHCDTLWAGRQGQEQSHVVTHRNITKLLEALSFFQNDEQSQHIKIKFEMVGDIQG